MDGKHEKIAKAAIETISRFGLRKMTMGDLAEAAGVSRQSLYNAYGNKDGVVLAAIRYSIDLDIEAVRQAWAKEGSLSEKLDDFFVLGPLYWFDKLQSTPEARDLMDDLKSTGSQELANFADRWTLELVGLFAPYEQRLTDMDLTPRDVAVMFFSTCDKAKYSSATREELTARLKTLKLSVLALLHAE